MPNVATQLANTTVHISAPPEQDSASHQALILLGFYTPKLGERYADLAPGLSWLSPDLPAQTEVIATWRDWALVRNHEASHAQTPLPPLSSPSLAP